jgi:hypothetical protein
MKALRPLKHRVQRLCYRSYATGKLWRWFLPSRMYRRARPPIVVYQMVKVGSMTVVRSLEQQGLQVPIFHIHSLTAPELERLEVEGRRRWGEDGRSASDCFHIWDGEYLRRRIDAGGGEPGGTSSRWCGIR